jgi:ABC-type multidrug transport system fused ATPase/permease subunit
LRYSQPIPIFLAIVFCFYALFSLLKQAKDLLPTKVFKKSKEEILGEYLERTNCLDKRIIEHCKELKDIELFYNMTRIKCKKNLRDGLIWFHDGTSSRFSWEFIRPAISYLHEREGVFYVRVPPLARLYWFFNIIFSIFYTLLLITLTIIMIFASYSKPKGNASFLVFIFIFILFLLIMILFTLWQTILPVTRADMISREINCIEGVLSRGKNRKNYIKMLFLILNSFHEFMLLFFKAFIDQWR